LSFKGNFFPSKPTKKRLGDDLAKLFFLQTNFSVASRDRICVRAAAAAVATDRVTHLTR